MSFEDFDFNNDNTIEKRTYHPNRIGEILSLEKQYDLIVGRRRWENQNGAVCCPYCGSKATLGVSGMVYGYGVSYADSILYICEPCNAWVGTRSGTAIPLDTLANSLLRKERKNKYEKKIKKDPEDNFIFV